MPNYWFDWLLDCLVYSVSCLRDCLVFDLLRADSTLTCGSLVVTLCLGGFWCCLVACFGRLVGVSDFVLDCCVMSFRFVFVWV